MRGGRDASATKLTPCDVGVVAGDAAPLAQLPGFQRSVAGLFRLAQCPDDAPLLLGHTFGIQQRAELRHQRLAGLEQQQRQVAVAQGGGGHGANLRVNQGGPAACGR